MRQNKLVFCNIILINFPSQRVVYNYLWFSFGSKYIFKVISSLNFLKFGVTSQSFILSILGTCSTAQWPREYVSLVRNLRNPPNGSEHLSIMISNSTEIRSPKGVSLWQHVKPLVWKLLIISEIAGSGLTGLSKSAL